MVGKRSGIGIGIWIGFGSGFGLFGLGMDFDCGWESLFCGNNIKLGRDRDRLGLV